MRGQANALFEARQPQLLPYTRRKPWVRRGKARPCPLVKAGKNHQIRLLQPCLQQAVDGDARVAALWRTHSHLFHHPAQQIR